MNCFEARQEFAGFWRRTIAAERRPEVLAHLHECAKCDRAFRIFALTAPALHSEPAPDASKSAPSSPSEFPFGQAARRIAIAPRPAPPRWMAIAAAAAIFVLSGAAAGLATYAPAPSLADAISNAATNPAASDTVADPFGLDQSAQVSGLAG
ncbi:MAG: hypothetical protein ACREQI_13010 [Candidatus Binataceae bacterium]